ncbi:MAG: peptidyl-prolyl cis-trans isomerase [Gammaproteobacteria bacterium]|nr:MAG: peptidyl-prolyl cis-trans isomerase [Gammaproteobacteria bacterium]
MMRRLLHEPLLHFLLLGGGLFLLYARLGGAPPAREQIVVTQAEIRRLANDWRARWRRPPTDAELAALIDDYLREELLYREALALGLDQGDEVIRRRLAQKLAFVETDPAALENPTDEQLRALYASRRNRYTEPVRLSFEQRLFSDRGQAAAALAALRGGADPAEFGDPSALKDRFRRVSEAELALLLGVAPAAQIFALPSGGWQGPVRSRYGVHLLRITERRPAREPPFDEIRERLRQDWALTRQRDAEAALLARLKSRYRIRIEPPPAAAEAQ